MNMNPLSNHSIPVFNTNNGTTIAEEATTTIHAFMTALAIGFHVVATFILIVQVRQDAQGKKQLRVTTAEAPKLLFLAGTLFILLGVYFSDDDSTHLIAALHEFYHITTGLVIGVGVLIFGCFMFMKKLPRRRRTFSGRRRAPSIEHNEPSNDDNEESEQVYQPLLDHDILPPAPRDRLLVLRQTQPLLSTYITMMTVSIVIIEMVFVLSPNGIKNLSESPEAAVRFHGIELLHLRIGTTTAYMIQIVVQNICYVFFIKNHRVFPRYVNSTRFFLQYMAFYNFTMFFNSLWERYWKQLEIYDNFRVAEDVYGHGSGINILFMMYSALAINMRVMFVYLFTEHARSLDKHEEGENDEIQIDIDPNRNDNNERNRDNNLNNNAVANQNEANIYIRVRVLSRDEKIYHKLGYFIGLSFVVLQMLMAVQYLKALDIGPWINILSVIENAGVMLVGFLIVHINIKRIAPNIIVTRDRTSFMRMVNFLGILSFIFDLSKTCLVIFLAVRSNPPNQSYYIWDAIKHVSGTISVLYVIGLINIINELSPVLRDAHEKFNRGLLPAIMLGILAMGIGVALDQYEGHVILFIRNEIDDSSIQMLLETGPPVVLAFFCDVFFCILVIFRD